jgi:D-glycero-D-manno-heptose 1,7-bisphosphate phosphatase
MSLSIKRLAHTKVVLLDRDGVINRKAPEPTYIERIADFELLPGVPEAIRLLNESGVLVIVVSNQRGVALGRFTEQDVQAMHQHMQQQLAESSAHLDAIYYCPHDRDECDCRKPKTGMLRTAFQDFPIADHSNTVLIGDGASDIAAARAFGIPCILIRREEPLEEQVSPDATADSLLEAAKLIVSVKAAEKGSAIS